MTGPLSPTIAGILQSSSAQHLAQAGLSQGVRRAQAKAKNSATDQDEVIFTVETAEAITAYRAYDEEHDEHLNRQRRRKALNHPGAGLPADGEEYVHLDVVG